MLAAPFANLNIFQMLWLKDTTITMAIVTANIQ